MGHTRRTASAPQLGAATEVTSPPPASAAAPTPWEGRTISDGTWPASQRPYRPNLYVSSWKMWRKNRMRRPARHPANRVATTPKKMSALVMLPKTSGENGVPADAWGPMGFRQQGQAHAASVQGAPAAGLRVLQEMMEPGLDRVRPVEMPEVAGAVELHEPAVVNLRGHHLHLPP